MNEPVLPYEPPKHPSAGRQAFGVIVRTVGLLIPLYGIYTAFYGFSELAASLTGHYTPHVYFIFGALYLVVGAALIRGEWLVRFAYGRQ